MLNDLRYALRQLRKAPGFTATALITLALALGANSAVFSLVNVAVIRPVLPAHRGDLVSVFTARQGAQRDYRRFSLAEYNALKDAHAAFDDVAAVSKAFAGVSADRDGSLDRSLVHLTTENFFELLGATLAQGRFYNADEAAPNARIPVAVASHAAWQRLGGRPDFVGSTIWVNGHPCTVIGIARESFTGGSVLAAPELWMPLGMFPEVAPAFDNARGDGDLTEPGNNALLVFARLRPGMTAESVAPQLPALARQLAEVQPPETDGARELQVAPLSRLGFTTGPVEDRALTLLSLPLLFMAGCVLAIASLNLANMLLARGTARTKEIALRLALGASRRRIVQQLLVEGLVLSFAGGAIGLLLSIWSNNAMIAALSGALKQIANLTFTLRPQLDLTVVVLTFLASVCATLLFSLAPALRASRLDVAVDLKVQGACSAAGERWNRFFAGRHLLVMTQIALSLVLLFSASLFLRGALTAGRIPLGFDTGGGLVTEMDFSLRNATPVEARRTLDAVLEHVNRMPGVAGAALTTQVPMGNTSDTRNVQPDGAAIDAPRGPEALYSGITRGYFSTIGVPLLRGRDFTDLEVRDTEAPHVAIIDTSLAGRLFPNSDALGRHIRLDGAAPGEADAGLEVVGIVAGHRHEFLEDEPTYHVFVPLVRAYAGPVYLQTRFAGAAHEGVVAAASALRAGLQEIDPMIPVLRNEPFADFIRRDASLWSARFGAVVFGLFGAIALLLSVMGVYSVKAYAVAQRTREIGIRSALGARPADILGLVMKQGARQIAVACGAGIVLSLLAGRALSSLLFHVSPADPLALAGAIGVLSVSALAASWLPARRATKVDPMVALRSE